MVQKTEEVKRRVQNILCTKLTYQYTINWIKYRIED